MAADWDARLYDERHHFVTEFGEALLEALAAKPGERILDVGCGTGHLTAKIAESGAEVVGIDSSPAMLETARSAHPHLRFELADASAFDFGTDFDAIFSNAALHWVTHADEAVRSMARALRPGGRLIAEFGGKGNIRRLIAALFDAFRSLGCPSVCHRWYFPSIGEYGSLLEKHGLEPRWMHLFDRPTPLEGEDGLRNWYAQFGSAIHVAADEACWNDAVRAAESALRSERFIDGQWIADYRRLRVMAVKAGGIQGGP